MRTGVSGGVTVNLIHDPLGRLDRYDPGATTRFIYDPIAGAGSEVAAEVSLSGTILRRYVRGEGADELLVEYAGGGTATPRFLHLDERMSAIAQSDSAGAMAAINRYDEYGIPASTNAGRFQYTGQMWLGEIGSYNYKNRMYAPHLGRFMQPDPIGYLDGPNRYAYVRNNPVNFVDPLGLQETPPPEPPAPQSGDILDDGSILVVGDRCRGVEGCYKLTVGRSSGVLALPASAPSMVPVEPTEAAQYNQSKNYCGGEGGHSLPNTVGGVSINDICFAHDQCFSSSGTSFEVCNQRFALAVAIRVSLYGLGISPINLIQGIIAGSGAYLVVRGWGRDYYVP